MNVIMISRIQVRFVARITNPQAHCLHSATAPLGTLVSGCSTQECLQLITRKIPAHKRTHLHTVLPEGVMKVFLKVSIVFSTRLKKQGIEKTEQ